MASLRNLAITILRLAGETNIAAALRPTASSAAASTADVDLHLYLAAALVTVRALIREVRSRHRAGTRATTGRLR